MSDLSRCSNKQFFYVAETLKKNVVGVTLCSQVDSIKFSSTTCI